MTAHADRIRQAEESAGVYDDATWEVGDLVRDPLREDLPDGAVLIDKGGDPWKLSAGDWYLPSGMARINPRREWGPYVVVWLPEEDA